MQPPVPSLWWGSCCLSSCWLFHASTVVWSPCWTGFSWWLLSAVLCASGTPSLGALLHTDTFLSSCRKDTKRQSHDGQHWPLEGLRVCQLREARRSPEGKRLLATRLLSQPCARCLLMFPPLLGGKPHQPCACGGGWMGRTWQRGAELLPCPRQGGLCSP